MSEIQLSTSNIYYHEVPLIIEFLKEVCLIQIYIQESNCPGSYMIADHSKNSVAVPLNDNKCYNAKCGYIYHIIRVSLHPNTLDCWPCCTI